MLNSEETDFLQKLINKLVKAKKSAEFSFIICKGIGIKGAYTEDEKDRFEALTSKFARLSDLIIKQAIKTIEIYELNEPPGTVRDSIAAAEKRGLISSEFKFIEIRKKRNIIAHEYLIDESEVIEIYEYILQNIDYLFQAVDKILAYCEKFFLPGLKSK